MLLPNRESQEQLPRSTTNSNSSAVMPLRLLPHRDAHATDLGQTQREHERALRLLEQAVLNLLGQEVPQLARTVERIQTWEHSGFDLYVGQVMGAYNKPATQNLTEYVL